MKLPAGTYKVRFICDDEKECAGFADKTGTKTLTVEAGSEVRFLAEFYELNRGKKRKKKRR